MKFVNIGFNNVLNADRVVAALSFDSASAKRLVQAAKDSGRAIDCTCGKKTRCVVVMDSDHVVLSAIQAETIAARMNGSDSDREDKDGIDGEEDKADE